MAGYEVAVATSHARRVGDEVYLLLELLDADLPTGDAEMRLVLGERRAKVPATVSAPGSGVLVACTVPAHVRGRGAWHLALRPAGATSFKRIDARLIVHRDQPVAVLPGPAPKTRLAAPAPRVAERSTAGAVRARLSHAVRSMRSKVGR
jgi:hypothetical protein